ncbi:MAG: hypothetical protein JNK40_05210 [Chromatiales bacterium]|nr:hypothetical protein [Chromatiales bacterium]
MSVEKGAGKRRGLGIVSFRSVQSHSAGWCKPHRNGVVQVISNNALKRLLVQLKKADQSLDETDASAKKELQKAILMVEAALEHREPLDVVGVLKTIGKCLDKLPYIVELMKRFIQ